MLMPCFIMKRSRQAAQGGADPSSVRDAVMDLWRRLDEQLHRIEAALPRGTTLLQCVAVGRAAGGGQAWSGPGSRREDTAA